MAQTIPSQPRHAGAIEGAQMSTDFFELVGLTTEWPGERKLEITRIKHWAKGDAERVYLSMEIDQSPRHAPHVFIRVRGNVDSSWSHLSTRFGDICFILDGSKDGAAKKAALERLFQ
jgi:hypothetical protein